METALRFEIASRTGRIVSPFEFLPGWLAYGPVVVQWIALGIWYGDLSLPTAANPRITTGGLCGESKTSILDQIGGRAREWIAPYTVMITGDNDPVVARAVLAQADLALPIVVKPDIGCNGTGVRLVRDEATLDSVMAEFPRGTKLVLQALIEHDGEAGIFYIRRPNEATGRITSVTLKYAPSVEGDGVSSLRELIDADPRHRRVQAMYSARLAGRLDDVPAAGVSVRLVFAGNHCKGSIFRNGADEVTAALSARVEEIARGVPEFHFGRIDVRYASLAALRRGEDLRVIEINGVGSEATHIWDPTTSLREVYAAQLYHYGAAFAIGREMRRRGVLPSGIRTMLRDWRMQLRLMASYPAND